jgi:hypothetical protein
MNIYTVRDNLKNTIKGKEEYLRSIQKEMTFVGLRDGEYGALSAVAKFLDININELKVILFDIEKCCEKATYDSWKENPDRMGGQFTDDEVDNATKWQ